MVLTLYDRLYLMTDCHSPFFCVNWVLTSHFPCTQIEYFSTFCWLTNLVCFHKNWDFGYVKEGSCFHGIALSDFDSHLHAHSLLYGAYSWLYWIELTAVVQFVGYSLLLPRFWCMAYQGYPLSQINCLFHMLSYHTLHVSQVLFAVVHLMSVH